MSYKDLLAAAYRRVFFRPHVPPEEPKLIVFIPVVGPENTPSWDRVCSRLSDTLGSIERQNYRNFEIVLCCQQRPPTFPERTNYHFVQAPPHAAAATKSDQNVKVRLMARYAARRFEGFSYVIQMDADDLMHPGLFDYIARDNNGRGYLIDSGYMMDAMSRRVAPLDGDDGHTPFWRQCGSCAAFAVDWTSQPFPVSYLRVIGNGHQNYGPRAAALGYPLDRIPFHAMIYLVNHGDNMQIRKGHKDRKLSYIANCEVSDPERLALIRRDFGVSEAA